MGSVDPLLGISGGTIAFITGIYDKWLKSIEAFDHEAFRMLKKSQIALLWQRVNGKFLLSIMAGIVASLFTIVPLITFLIENYGIMIRSFFLGLMLIIAPLFLRQIKKLNILTIIGLLSGIACAYGLTLLAPIPTPDGLPMIFVIGILSVASMMIPGLSGTFLLLLFAKYQYIMAAFAEMNVAVILVFTLGCTAGLLSLSRIIRWILSHYHSVAVALLTGLMLGALNKIWPWRETLEYVTNSKGEQVPAFDRSILPWNYMTITGKDPQVFQAILMMALGVFIVVLFEKVAARIKTKI